MTREKRWNEIAYGVWVCRGGREVLFNRRYKPIWERRDGVVKAADRAEWVNDILTSVNFYNDGHSEKQKREQGLAIMKEWGIETKHHASRRDAVRAV